MSSSCKRCGRPIDKFLSSLCNDCEAKRFHEHDMKVQAREQNKLLEEQTKLTKQLHYENQRYNEKMERIARQNQDYLQQREFVDFRDSIKDALIDIEDDFEKEEFSKTLKRIKRVIDRIDDSKYSFANLFNVDQASNFWFMYCYSCFLLSKFETCKNEAHKAIDMLVDEYEISELNGVEEFLKLFVLYIKAIEFECRISGKVDLTSCPPFNFMINNIFSSQFVYSAISKEDHDGDSEEIKSLIELHDEKDLNLLNAISLQYMRYAIHEYEKTSAYESDHNFLSLIFSTINKLGFENNDFFGDGISAKSHAEKIIHEKISEYESSVSQHMNELSVFKNLLKETRLKSKSDFKKTEISSFIIETTRWLIVSLPILGAIHFSFFGMGATSDTFSKFITFLIVGFFALVPSILISMMSDLILKILIVKIIHDKLEENWLVSSQSVTYLENQVNNKEINILVCKKQMSLLNLSLKLISGNSNESSESSFHSSDLNRLAAEDNDSYLDEEILVSDSDADLNMDSESKIYKKPIFSALSALILIIILFGLFANRSSEQSVNQQYSSTHDNVSISPVPTENNSDSGATLPQTDSSEQEIASVIKNWQDVKKEAYLNKDTSALSSVLSEPALKIRIEGVEYWGKSSDRFYNNLTLKSLEFGKIEVTSPNSATADVHVIESHDTSEGSKEVNGDFKYFLQKIDSKWYIYDIKQID